MRVHFVIKKKNSNPIEWLYCVVNIETVQSTNRFLGSAHPRSEHKNDKGELNFQNDEMQL